MADQLGSRPGLLQDFRTRAGFAPEAVATKLGVGRTTIFNWENGRTDGPDQHQLKALDELYGAGGVLRDLYLALRTPDALPSGGQWYHNFQGESGPCWAWVRVKGDKHRIVYVDAGPFRAEQKVQPGAGVFLQAHAFAPNPPVHVQIEGEGWADFGKGVLPPDIGAPVVNAIDIAVIGPRDTPDYALVMAGKSWLPYTKYKGMPTWFAALKERLGDQVERARTALVSAARAVVSMKTDVSSMPASLDEVPRHWGGEPYRRLRDARGLSLQDIAELATKLDASLPPVTKDHVHRLEHGSTPRVPQLVERLDAVLGADGRTCTVEVTDVQATGRLTAITFPTYWIGPVWVQFLRTGQTEDNNATLLWSPWRKKLTLCHSVVVTTRRAEPAQPPLRVDLPPGWEVRAGVGVHPRAVDVQVGWGLINVDLGSAALGRYFAVMKQAFDGARPR
ncbi:helix-turn-helix domain-containing protein [Umezawaea tangerina]|uniref:Helix-turn-helix protein n=1 Tax=Umezawaea tangerina TaxID=84725 RepID=A0A2T0SNT7_9PSEU|nr:helix-turn-helix transcriptional regulator [Umezawaea tangerina]PRY35084.1 helix-turn-helix protein [Umezawaea tangerina]